ncbi:hypothetical protein HDV04_005692 [Boothiomyces sp. JEL0838]|nr:hypothetical protein HDV04_005692 [Boothiomyces sp. JEL0838]
MNINPVTLDYLLTLEQDVSVCALYVHRELPIRLARRVRAIEKLPFIVGVNPYISQVYELYRDSFSRLIEFPTPKTEELQKEYASVLAELTEHHQSVIPNLAKGFKECGRYMSQSAKQEFLDEMIRARIGIRVIAEHYLSLQSPRAGWIGVVNTQSSPTAILTSICNYVQQLCEFNYGTTPEYEIHGFTDTKFAYINVHMEYIFMELIKNAMRATVEESNKLKRFDHPPVEICIGRSNDDVIIRFRDQGGGIPLKDQPRVWEYSFTTVEKEDEDDFLSSQSRMSMVQATGGPIAGLGFGLPMSRVYAKYFGGSLEFRSVSGHGTDVFLQFPNISRNKLQLKIE